eukprot:343064-Rhodomonas_salina.1
MPASSRNCRGGIRTWLLGETQRDLLRRRPCSTCYLSDLHEPITAQSVRICCMGRNELCIHKCEVAAYDFRTNSEINTRRVRYNGQLLAHLSADQAVRYLGLRLNVQGDTSAEVSYVMESMKTAATRFKGHQYSYRQGFSLVPTAIQQVFTYSVSVTGWTTATLQSVHDLWGLMGKRAWDLTEGHHSTPFLTPDTEGGIAQASPFHLAAKHSLRFLQTVCEGMQSDILTLVQDEWEQLCTTWGTRRPQEIQAALLLDDTALMSRTLLSRTLYYLGHAGIVLAWERLPDLIRPAPYPDDIDRKDRTLIGALWEYVRYRLSIRREMRKGSASNRALASGIANL